MALTTTEGEEPPKKKISPLVMTIAAVVVLTIVGGAGGWFLGKTLSAQIQPPPAAKPDETAKVADKAAAKPDAGLPRLDTPENGVIQLEAITTNLAFPSDRWVRLEVALMFKDKPDEKIAEQVHQDIALYLRTVTLQQIEGPRGFQFLKEDLEERADLISEGKVAGILFRTFVIQ
jgi:flagellar FliL protein